MISLASVPEIPERRESCVRLVSPAVSPRCAHRQHAAIASSDRRTGSKRPDRPGRRREGPQCLVAPARLQQPGHPRARGCDGVAPLLSSARGTATNPSTAPVPFREESSRCSRWKRRLSPSRAIKPTLAGPAEKCLALRGRLALPACDLARERTVHRHVPVPDRPSTTVPGKRSRPPDLQSSPRPRLRFRPGGVA